MRNCEVYTDGSCEPNPGLGSYAFALLENGVLLSESSGVQPRTTNNRMEYLALIRALEEHGSIIKTAFTDSDLLVKTCMEWRFLWKKNGWVRKRRKKPPMEIKNLDLVLRLDELLNMHPVEVVWVRGHSGNEWNEYADSLAERARIIAAEKILP